MNFEFIHNIVYEDPILLITDYIIKNNTYSSDTCNQHYNIYLDIIIYFQRNSILLF